VSLPHASFYTATTYAVPLMLCLGVSHSQRPERGPYRWRVRWEADSPRILQLPINASRDSDGVRCRAYEHCLVACAKRGDTALSFCRFDGLVGQGEKLVHDPSGTRLRLFSRGRSHSSSFRSTVVVDELARGSWSSGLLWGVFGTCALEEVIELGEGPS
jgi:hypothetical protein